MESVTFGPLVTADWLAKHLQAPDIRVLDASWYLPNDGRDARAEYQAGHIPGAGFFDLDEISDQESPLPHMLPGPEKFASAVRKLGIGNHSRVVVYDGGGVYAAVRAWWMFRIFDHPAVAVLDGGLHQWRARGLPVETLPTLPRSGHYAAGFRPEMVCALPDILNRLEDGKPQILDARGPGRFSGAEAEPRAGLRSGHIPGSLNLHYARLFNADHTMAGEKAIRAELDRLGVDLAAPVITTCGSGVTAAILAFALHRIGKQDVTLYDGSWVEWGSAADTPVATGTSGEPA